MSGLRILCVIDGLNDFMDDGIFGNIGARALMTRISRELIESGEYDLIIASDESHPVDNFEFASTHGVRVGDIVTKNGYPQMVFPKHGVVKTWGNEFARELRTDLFDKVIHKGRWSDVAAHSIWASRRNAQGQRYETGLAEYIGNRKVDCWDYVGMLFDICVSMSALDSAERGYRTRVLKPYTLSYMPENDESVIRDLEKAGVEVVL